MKPQQQKLFIIVIGVVVALLLTLGNVHIHFAQSNNQENLASKYKSTVPLITAPLQILAKGLNIIE